MFRVVPLASNILAGGSKLMKASTYVDLRQSSLIKFEKMFRFLSPPRTLHCQVSENIASPFEFETASALTHKDVLTFIPNFVETLAFENCIN